MTTSIPTLIAAPQRALPKVASLSQDALCKRLRDLAGSERELQVDFLLYLSEFDRRKGYLDAGHGSLWSYCLRELHLREGPAARRIGAMRVLRQYPELEAPLRDGRLCLSTVTMIAPLFTEHGVASLVARAAYLTKSEIEHLVATLRPIAAPREGVRLIASQPAAQRDCAAGPGAVALAGAPSAGTAHNPATSPSPCSSTSGKMPRRAPELTAAVPKNDRPRAELRPVAAEQWSLRVTMDAEMKNDLDTLESLLSHSLGGDLTSVVREALRCAVEKHGKRRGAVAPTRSRAAPRTKENTENTASLKLTNPHRSRVSMVRKAAPAVKSLQEGAAPTDGHAAPAERTARPAPPEQSAASEQPAGSAPTRASASAHTPSAPPVRSVPPTPNALPTAAPQLARTPVAAARSPRAISAAVRREVWVRDGSCCSWRGTDGRRCGSRWKVEIDHIIPAAFGGAPTVGNLRLLCRAHNVRHAEKVFGRRHMARFGARSRDSTAGAAARTSAGGAAAEMYTPPVDELALGSVLADRA